MLSLGDIVDPDIVSLEPEMTLEDAARLLERHRLRAAPVLQHGKVLGLISLAAIRGLVGNQPLRVGDLRLVAYHALPPEIDVREALAYARDTGADHVLVLDQGRLVGVVATTRLQSSLPFHNHGKDGASVIPHVRTAFVPLDDRLFERALALEGAHG